MHTHQLISHYSTRLLYEKDETTDTEFMFLLFIHLSGMREMHPWTFNVCLYYSMSVGAAC